MNLKLKEIIDNYIYKEMKDNINYVRKYESYASELNYESYVERAIVFNPDHMWNVERFNLHDEYRQLGVYIKNNKTQIENCKNFDDIIRLINKANIKNIGELADYDKSLAMAIYKGVKPDKIFMHAGPRNAAKFILGNQYNNVVKILSGTESIEYIDIKDLPEEFNVFNGDAYLIEVCLCYIHSNYLKK